MYKKKSILIITGVFLPEPVVSAKILSDLSLELSKSHNIIVLRPRPSRPPGFKLPYIDLESLPYKVEVLDSFVYPKSKLLGRFYESFSMGKASVNYIKKNWEDIDLIYNAPWNLIGRFMISKAAKKFKIPYITPVQDIYPESIVSKIPKVPLIRKLIVKALLPLDKYTLQKAVLIHTISFKMRDYLSHTRKIKKEKFIVVANWQDESSFLNSLKSANTNKQKPFVFMYLGNIAPTAGLDKVMDSFIKADLNNTKLIIAGSGSQKPMLIKSLKKYEVNNIEFIDAPSKRVPEIQARSDVMILPLINGVANMAIPSKLPAYMFSAKPILAIVDYDSEVANIVNNANCGWVVSPNSVNDISNKFREIRNFNINYLIKLGTNGLNYSMKYYSKQNNLNKLAKVFNKILN